MVKKVNSIRTTDTSDLVKKKPDYNIKFNEIEQRITNDDLGKYITAQEFVKLMADNFAVSLK